eukprot:m.6020 g.6020  ORF g.6020 m.6020 type:complete len:511 (-) comp4669_c0_seq1:32-1564(-)
MSVVVFLTLASAVLPGPVAALSRSINVTPSSLLTAFCEPFGSTLSLFSAYTYYNLPAFSVQAGDVIAFDSVSPNDVPVCRAVFVGFLNTTPPTTCSASPTTMPSPWIQLTSLQCVGTGNNITGDFDLHFSISSALNFTGGTLALALSAAGAISDTTCSALSPLASCSDASGHFGTQIVGNATQGFSLPFLLTAAPPSASGRSSSSGTFDGGLIAIIIIAALLLLAILAFFLARRYNKNKPDGPLPFAAPPRLHTETLQWDPTSVGGPTPQIARPPRARRLTAVLINELQIMIAEPRSLQDRITHWARAIPADALPEESPAPSPLTLTGVFSPAPASASTGREGLSSSSQMALLSGADAAGRDSGNSVTAACEDGAAHSAPALLLPTPPMPRMRSPVVGDGQDTSETASTTSAVSGPQPTRGNRIRHDSLRAEIDEAPALRALPPQTPPSARRAANTNPLSPRRETSIPMSPLSLNPNTPGRSSHATAGSRPRLRSIEFTDSGPGNKYYDV